jgi:hypothetical protein
MAKPGEVSLNLQVVSTWAYAPDSHAKLDLLKLDFPKLEEEHSSSRRSLPMQHI